MFAQEVDHQPHVEIEPWLLVGDIDHHVAVQLTMTRPISNTGAESMNEQVVEYVLYMASKGGLDGVLTPTRRTSCDDPLPSRSHQAPCTADSGSKRHLHYHLSWTGLSSPHRSIL